jgi:cell division protein FtsL
MSEESGTGIGRIIYTIVLLSCIVAALFFISKNQRQVDAVQQKIEDLKADNERKEKLNKELDENIGKMNTPEFIEKIARDELNMARPGETIYEFTDEKKKNE